MNKIITTLFSSALFSLTAFADDIDFSNGVFFVNEDWYGHQNSTINYLEPDEPDGNYWHYRVFQTANPDHELGCTNQFGALWNGRFYLIAKQEKDPGASITGGRITVADAANMKVLYQSELIDPSGNQCDGRGFAGYDDHTGYISSSHGVWHFDLDDFEVTGMVEGTENPNGFSEGGNTNAAGALYHGQCGSMVVAEGYLFVAHQTYGLLKVDPKIDKVIDILSMDVVKESAGIGSVVKSLDGMLWCSVAENLDGQGETLPYIVKVDPATMEFEIVEIKDGNYPPANSWYAWTPDGFCASEKTNSLFWNGGDNSWFSNTKIYRYDIDTGVCKKIIDFEELPGNWKLYGCSMRPHPVTDELYLSLFHEFVIPTYMTRRVDRDGKTIKDYEMIENYWFPSLSVFPQSKRNHTDPAQSAVTGIETRNVDIIQVGNVLRAVNAQNKTIDIFNLHGSIVKSVMIDSDNYALSLDLAPGFYVAKIEKQSIKIIIK